MKKKKDADDCRDEVTRAAGHTLVFLGSLAFHFTSFKVVGILMDCFVNLMIVVHDLCTMNGKIPHENPINLLWPWKAVIMGAQSMNIWISSSYISRGQSSRCALCGWVTTSRWGRCLWAPPRSWRWPSTHCASSSSPMPAVHSNSPTNGSRYRPGPNNTKARLWWAVLIQKYRSWCTYL